MLAEKAVLAAKAGEKVPWLPGFEGKYEVPNERNWFIKITTVSRSEEQAPRRSRLDVRDLLNQ